MGSLCLLLLLEFFLFFFPSSFAFCHADVTLGAVKVNVVVLCEVFLILEVPEVRHEVNLDCVGEPWNIANLLDLSQELVYFLWDQGRAKVFDLHNVVALLPDKHGVGRVRNVEQVRIHIVDLHVVDRHLVQKAVLVQFPGKDVGDLLATGAGWAVVLNHVDHTLSDFWIIKDFFFG